MIQHKCTKRGVPLESRLAMAGSLVGSLRPGGNGRGQPPTEPAHALKPPASLPLMPPGLSPPGPADAGERIGRLLRDIIHPEDKIALRKLYSHPRTAAPLFDTVYEERDRIFFSDLAIMRCLGVVRKTFKNEEGNDVVNVTLNRLYDADVILADRLDTALEKHSIVIVQGKVDGIARDEAPPILVTYVNGRRVSFPTGRRKRNTEATLFIREATVAKARGKGVEGTEGLLKESPRISPIARREMASEPAEFAQLA